MGSFDLIQGLSTLESLRGFELLRILPSVLPVISLQTSCGFHRFEPVEWNGVATAPGNVTYPTRNFATLGPFILFRSARVRCSRNIQAEGQNAFLHIAMQIGLYHPPDRGLPGLGV